MWCARFTDSQIETLRQLIRIQGEVGADLRGALEALELARFDDLPEARLPWGEVAERARTQGVSEADVVWDMAGHRDEPPGSGAAPRRTGAKRPRKGPRRSKA